MPQSYWPSGGLWALASDIKGRVAGAWASSRVALIGKDGRWQESYSSETEAQTIKIETMTDRAGTPLQGGIILSGSGMTSDPIPSPGTYAYYILKSGLTDYLENFGDIRLVGGGVAEYLTGANAGIRLRKSVPHSLKSSTDYDALGLLGSGTTKYILFGMQYQINSAPSGSKTYLFDIASATGQLSVYVEGSDLKVRWKNATDDFAAVVTGACPSYNTWYGFYVLRVNGSTTVTIKTESGATASFTGAPWFTPGGADLFTIGYGLDSGVGSNGDVTIRRLMIRNAALASISLADDIINPATALALGVKPFPSGAEVEYSSSILSAPDGLSCAIAVPDIAPGNYLFRLKRGSVFSDDRLFSVIAPSYRTTPLILDESNISTASVDADFIVAHKKWGGDSGGVVQENVAIHGANIRVTSCGDNYTGPVRGVDNRGLPTAVDKTIGGCLVTRDYFGPGSYRIELKMPQSVGACSAMWTFHYEEGYPGTPLYDDLIADGLDQEGDELNGYYAVRNHEIDIEVPTALASNPDQEDVSYQNARFNCWRGETTGTYTADTVAHGVNLNDGQYHEIGFDWVLDPTPKIDFFIDGVLHHTLTTNIPDIPGRLWIGVWFPRGSVGNRWAGFPADYDEEYMDIRKLSIVPASSAVGIRNIGETYPNDAYRVVPRGN